MENDPNNPNRQSVDINVNVSVDRARFDDDDEPEVEPCVCAVPPPCGDVIVSRSNTSRYKVFETKKMQPGMTVSAIRKALWDEFCMSEKLVSVKNGEDTVGDEYVTKAGDRIHFNPAPKDRG